MHDDVGQNIYQLGDWDCSFASAPKGENGYICQMGGKDNAATIQTCNNVLFPSSQEKENFYSFLKAFQGHLGLAGLLRNCKQGYQGAFQKSTAEPYYWMPWGLKNAFFFFHRDFTMFLMFTHLVTSLTSESSPHLFNSSSPDRLFKCTTHSS